MARLLIFIQNDVKGNLGKVFSGKGGAAYGMISDVLLSATLCRQPVPVPYEHEYHGNQ